ncbi:hypothetical protein [Pseudosporangium ferrugineum]|uniref:Uncharacterized protein n=1 Tax=Pseudosporangium ferrugineum TaxID=439699 RepID=A0A2T0SB78_9ACTN|nr:hypothetical protein [Pseudosporangium ferrugineum]PRY30662.1 hypothetical protein CLV70_104214 [Pseudosporangium ferrugineum]
MAFGADQNINIANASAQDIYVLAAGNTGWTIADVLGNAALMFTGLGELKGIVSAGELPAAINTIGDLYKALRVGAALVRAGGRGYEAGEAVVSAFKKNSADIQNGQVKNVREQGTLSTFLNPSGIAGLLGAGTVSLTVMSGDGLQVAQFDSGPDDSWIATGNQTIVRSVYGTLWDQDPAAGSQSWPMAQAAATV